MNVLSLFDGISCLQIALERAGIKVSKYYSYEINKDAIKVTQYNYPNTIQMGSVTEMDLYSLPEMDLISAGSPCQDISRLNKKQKGLSGQKSSLFYYFIKAKEKWPNAKWLVENVIGNGSLQITSILKTRPIRLNSSWIVPQTRDRMYWTNIGVNTLPDKKYFKLKDILEEVVDNRYYQSAAWLKWWEANKDHQLRKAYSTLNASIANCLTARMYASWNGNFVQDAKGIRRLTTKECERLQTLPEGYTSVISDNKAYAAIGNGWTVDIVTHILKHINK